MPAQASPCEPPYTSPLIPRATGNPPPCLPPPILPAASAEDRTRSQLSRMAVAWPKFPMVTSPTVLAKLRWLDREGVAWPPADCGRLKGEKKRRGQKPRLFGICVRTNLERHADSKLACPRLTARE